jgi:hypothetical protein
LGKEFKAVELYIKYDFYSGKVIKELEYPIFEMLPTWYEEYHTRGSLHETKKGRSKL